MKTAVEIANSIYNIRCTRECNDSTAAVRLIHPSRLVNIVASKHRP